MKLISDCFYFPCKILGLLGMWEGQIVVKYFWRPLFTFLFISGNNVICTERRAQVLQIIYILRGMSKLCLPR